MPLAFKSLMKESEKEKNSRIVLALDITAEDPEKIFWKSMLILEKVHEYICALKINHHLILPLGLFNGVRKILDRAHKFGLPTIMDCKANDVGHTNRVIAENYFKAGFDALIANPFVGWEDGLQPIFEIAKEMDRGVILLAYMSHKSAWEGYGQSIYDPTTGKIKPQYVVFAEKALLWGADGVVAGATYPEKIKEIHTTLKGLIPIYSPGIGVQGGRIRETLAAGAHYLIVGRSIINAEKPSETAKKFRDLVNNFIGENIVGSSRP